MSVPESLLRHLDESFAVIDDRPLAESLRAFARQLYAAAYDFRFQHRRADDNRVEHELVVLRQTVRICWRSGAERASGEPFTPSELRVAIATAILHDLRYLQRITEKEINAHRDAGRTQIAEELRQQKEKQRLEHMQGGATDAATVLADLPGLMTGDEVRQCRGYISLHDAWKLSLAYPLASDWLAVCCLEGDALFPLEPLFGPLADLQREGIAEPTHPQLCDQAAANLKNQLMGYRVNFACTGEVFLDKWTILRTREGAAILAEYLKHWGISWPANPAASC